MAAFRGIVAVDGLAFRSLSDENLSWSWLMHCTGTAGMTDDIKI